MPECAHAKLTLLLQALLHLEMNVQVCDATGDAIKCKSRVPDKEHGFCID